MLYLDLGGDILLMAPMQLDINLGSWSASQRIQYFVHVMKGPLVILINVRWKMPKIWRFMSRLILKVW